MKKSLDQTIDYRATLSATFADLDTVRAQIAHDRKSISDTTDLDRRVAIAKKIGCDLETENELSIKVMTLALEKTEPEIMTLTNELELETDRGSDDDLLRALRIALWMRLDYFECTHSVLASLIRHGRTTLQAAKKLELTIARSI